MASFEEEIKNVVAEYVNNYNSKNFGALANMYTGDCLFMSPGELESVGTADTGSAMQKFYEEGYTRLEIIRKELLGPFNGDTAIERAKFTFFRDDGKPNFAGKSVMLWVKINGQWKAKWDIFNSDST